MTALKQYQRLESGGLWRATPDVQRREVLISFGNATLVVADTAGRPLTHWSLPAVARLNVGERPALFAPDVDATETLEIEDPLMIDAIETVRKSLTRARPHPGLLRHLTKFAVVATIGATLIFWLPGALTRQTLSVVPQSKRVEIGATILGHLQTISGPICRGAAGQAALTRLIPRILGRDTQNQIVVLPTLRQGAAALPGGLIAIDFGLIAESDDPAIPAGYVLAAHTSRASRDPLAPVLAQAGLQNTLRLLTTGELPPDTLHTYALALGTADPAIPASRALLANFDAAKVPSSPYANARASRGLADSELSEQDPMSGRIAPEILSDQDWVGLQGICDE